MVRHNALVVVLGIVAQPCAAFILVWLSLIGDSSALGDEWAENFDGYADGTLMHDVGGWRGWNGNPLNGGLISTLHARSGPNSLMVLEDSDLVRSFDRYTQGQWILSAYLYISSTVTGYSNLNLQATYTEGVEHEATAQVGFDSRVNMVLPNYSPISVEPLPTIVRDTWVPIEFFIDLDNDMHEFFTTTASSLSRALGLGISVRVCLSRRSTCAVGLLMEMERFFTTTSPSALQIPPPATPTATAKSTASTI